MNETIGNNDSNLKESPSSSWDAQTKLRKDYRLCLYLLSTLIRSLLLLYSSYHDTNFDVKYTDIDYNVYTDAANLVIAGRSPYERHTYRYPPLISYLMIFNNIFHKDTGKVIFLILDIIVGYIIEKSITVINEKKRLAIMASWLLNPFVISISSRGSSDSLICLLVLISIYLVTNKYIVGAAFFFGLSVHVKIYPIIYSLPLLLYLYDETSIVKSKIASLIGSFSGLYRLPKALILNINKKQVLFFVISVCTFAGITFISYHYYGFEFLYETYLYHYLRKDHRHNFSIYFNLIHHIVDNKTRMNLILSFIPQLLCVVVFSLIGLHNLPLSLFLQTISFVSLNKVCTSQYLIWWIAILPLVLSYVDLNKNTSRRLALSAFLMLAFKAVWLFWAYRLEFLGYNTYINLLFSSCAFTFFQMHFGIMMLKSITYE